MGSKISRPAEPEQPQLYAVATPHPTLQYIYPVYASPIDLSKTPLPEKRGRSSPLTWRSDKSKGRKEVQIVNEHTEHLQQEPPVGINDDGAWYHFRKPYTCDAAIDPNSLQTLGLMVMWIIYDLVFVRRFFRVHDS